MAELSSRSPGIAGIQRAQGKIAQDKAAVLEKFSGD
jgi:hypothetical protein